MPEEQRTPEMLEKIRVRQERARQEYAMRDTDVCMTWFGSFLFRLTRYGLNAPWRFFPRRWRISVKPVKRQVER
jgi:hypothetical protein